MKIKKTDIKVWILLILLFAALAVSIAFADSGSQITVSMLNQNPSPARAGDTVKVSFQVQNLGSGPANNVEMQILPDYPFSMTENSTQSISTLAAYQSGDYASNLDFNIKIDKDAIKGTYPLRVQYRYDNSGWITANVNIDVDNKEYAQIIYLDKAKLDPGKETDLNFTVSNVGSSPLQNMVFSWNEATGVILPVYSDDTRYIKYLDVGQSVQLSYKVVADVNAKPGLYRLDLKLNYESVSNSTPSVISSKAGVFVGGETDFDVAFSESTAGQTSLSVANTGNNPAQSVSVVIPVQQDFNIQGSNSAIIGNLDKGDYTIVSFQISSRAAAFANATAGQNQGNRASRQGNFSFRNITGSANASANNILKVDIEYTDTTGERVTLEKDVPINFRSGSATATSFSGRNTATSNGFVGGTIFWILLIAVILVAGWYTYKKVSKKSLAKTMKK